MIRKDMKYDVRAQKHRVRRGEMSRQEIDAHLASLPDDAAESEPTRTEFVATWDKKSQS